MTVNDNATAPGADPATAKVSLIKPAGFIRRTGAMIYDALLVLAVLMIATVPFLPFVHGKVLVPQEVGWLAYLYRAWLVFVVVLFFVFFWTRRGQTVGMQAWRLRLENESGELLTWPQSFKRLVLAMLPWLPGLLMLVLAEHLNSMRMKQVGYGLLLLGVLSLATLWWDPERRTWHDRWTHSRVVVRSKR